jgi:hypothetical protein
MNINQKINIMNKTHVSNFYYGEESLVFIALSELQLTPFVKEKKNEWRDMERNCSGGRGDYVSVTIPGAEEENEKIFKANRVLIEAYKKENELEGAVDEKTLDAYNFKLTSEYAEFEDEIEKLEKEEEELLEQLAKVKARKEMFKLKV